MPKPDPVDGSNPVASDERRLMARSVGHELRQPLSLIVGYAELLDTRPLPEAERAALIGEIRRAAARLTTALDVLERGRDLPTRSFGHGAERRVLDLRPAAGRLR